MSAKIAFPIAARAIPFYPARFLEPVRVEVYGTPGERAMEMDKPLVEAGVPFTFKPRHVGGFNRSSTS